MLAFDLETVADVTALPLLPPCEAPGNYKDPDKIAAAIAERTAERNAKLALDPDCCRIVAIGYTFLPGQAEVLVCPTIDAERLALDHFWQLWSAPGSYPVGYNCVAFDLPVLIQRSRILRVDYPRIMLRKYGTPDCHDLMLDLSHGGLTSYKGLGFWCQRFTLDVPEDATSGKDIAALVAANSPECWATVEAHCQIDVIKTYALAQVLYPALCVIDVG
jgi:hypothetical protein